MDAILVQFLLVQPSEIPQFIECEVAEQIRLWLAALRDFLAQIDPQWTAFCQAHQRAEEVAAQLAQGACVTYIVQPSTD